MRSSQSPGVRGEGLVQSGRMSPYLYALRPWSFSASLVPVLLGSVLAYNYKRDMHDMREMVHGDAPGVEGGFDGRPGNANGSASLNIVSAPPLFLAVCITALSVHAAGMRLIPSFLHTLHAITPLHSSPLLEQLTNATA